VQRVLDAGLLLLHLGLGRGADLDDGHAADELGEALLELLAIVVAGGVLDLLADLLTRPLIASLSPAPSTMVVLSLSISTLLGAAEVWRVAFSSFWPRSSMMTSPPVRIAMSCSIALRRSPKPGP
jgi:hypothetical protein